MLNFSKIIHFNRDENSFTSRVFEGYLFPIWKKYPSSFFEFIAALKIDSSRNLQYLSKRLGQVGIKPFCFEIDVTFKDSMLFLENLDIYGYCVNNNIEINLGSNNIDKTEFDCVIVVEDARKHQYVFVFEIKCFTDLKTEEILRQNNLLLKYKDASLFKDFFHFALLSTENIQNGTVFKNLNSRETHNGIYIIDWTSIFDYLKFYKDHIVFPRFENDIEFKSLYKTITKSGEYRTNRKIIKPNNANAADAKNRAR